MQNRTNRAVIVSMIVCIFVMGTSAAFGDMIPLTDRIQGKGNKGLNFRPVDEFASPVNFVMTARTMIDASNPFMADAVGQVGSVYIEKRNKGAGVQDVFGRGSKGISGKGRHADEELIFTYDNAVSLDSISIFVSDLDFGRGVNDKDDPVIFLQVSGTPDFGVTIMESEIVAAYTRMGKKTGKIDFSRFTSIGGGTAIAAFSVRETNGHIYVTGGGTGSAVPEPGTLGLLGIGSVAMIKRRRARA